MIKPFKRIVVLSDGSWNTLESSPQSNIIKLACAIDREDTEGVQQLVFYDPGVGTTGGVTDFVLGGAVGEGIDRNIQQLYTVLALNYDEGDEIYLIGYSRGAYTVRSLAGLIYRAGLVRHDHIHAVPEAYRLYRRNVDPAAREYIDFQRAHGGRVPIKLVACFDTVGGLGLPFGGVVQMFNESRYAFHDTVVGENIENGIHMVSIDEDRNAFSPTPMTANPLVGQAQVSELYFWGTHAEVGGQFEAGKATLRWLVREMQRRGLGLQLNSDKIPTEYDHLNKPKTATFMMNILRIVAGQHVRRIDSVAQLHPDAIRRYKAVASWRPVSLEPLSKSILSFALNEGAES